MGPRAVLILITNDTIQFPDLEVESGLGHGGFKPASVVVEWARTFVYFTHVAPAELEALLLGRTDISDAAVIGVPDDVAGELPKAFIVKAPGAELSEEDVTKFIEGKVAHTKWLRGGVQFVDQIPRNPSGKIMRRVIKDMYMTLASSP